ncbi:MAG TPA: tetratricopeptide repeat protein [Methylovirgula sp.]|nr:tetratricopeptide repeat protein [Methylovirgula sp.]
MSIRSFPDRMLHETTTAAFIAALAAMLIAIPVGLQIHRQANWCSDDVSDPAQQIKGCTRVIESSRGPGVYVAFAYNIRGKAYQAAGDFDRAIADYTEAIRLDPKYAFVHKAVASNTFRNSEFKALDVAP